MSPALEPEGLLEQCDRLHSRLEEAFFHQLQTAVLTPQVIGYLAGKILKVQQRKKAASEQDKRIRESKGEIERIIAAIAAIGHSDALVANLKARETESREISAAKQINRELTAGEISEAVSNAMQDIPKLLAKSPQTAKTKLAQHIDQIRMIPQPDGSYLAEGKRDLLVSRVL